jgi:hypothetical protein
LNNAVVNDNRIPPYKMRYNEAKKRNALPVPETQYGNPGPGGFYDYWDQLELDQLKPADPGDGTQFAVRAEISLLYQGTSWEYIQFLNNANDGSVEFLGAEGVNMLEAWINAKVPVAMDLDDDSDHKMVPPIVMASTTWPSTPTGENTIPACIIDSPAPNATFNVGEPVTYTGKATDEDGDIIGYSWSFEGGTPAPTTENPVNVTYSVAGAHETTFSATDNDGAECADVTLTITVESVGEPMDCSDYSNKSACNADSSCKWSNKRKICQDR